jgi:hypothetical protein
MVGGIPESACINEYYETVFTFKVGDTIVFNGFEVPLVKISLTPTGAVAGLPPGLTYACNPPSCVFLANTSGCAVVYGTVQAGTPPGEYLLLINATVTLPVFGDIPQQFPGALFPNSSFSIEEMEICIYDFTGRLLNHQPVNVQQGENNFQLDFSNFESGMYMYSVGKGKESQTGKLIIAR